MVFILILSGCDDGNLTQEEINFEVLMMLSIN
jgi:hypothetical protein